MTEPDLDHIITEVIDEMDAAPDDLMAQGLLRPSQAKFVKATTSGAVDFLINRLKERGFRLKVVPLEVPPDE